MLSAKKIQELKNIIESIKNTALENIETDFYDQGDTRKDFTELASLAESAEGILYG